MAEREILQRSEFITRLISIAEVAEADGHRTEVQINKRASLEVMFEELSDEQWALVRKNVSINTTEEGADFIMWADEKKGYTP